MELHPSESARKSVRLFVGPLPPDAVPSRIRQWLDRPEQCRGLRLDEILWLRERLAADGAMEPLKELLKGGRMELPSPVTPDRNPELESRCQRLRAEQEERSYRRMVRGVDSNQLRKLSIEMGKQTREVNAQLWKSDRWSSRCSPPFCSDTWRRQWRPAAAPTRPRGSWWVWPLRWWS